MSPRSRRPSAEVQAAREAALSADLRQRVQGKRNAFRVAMARATRLMATSASEYSRGLIDVLSELREAHVQLEILIEQTAKLEKAERESL